MLEQYAYYETALGLLEIGYSGTYISKIKFTDIPHGISIPSPLSDLAGSQILEYLCGSRKHFDFPACPTGTDFQRAVWNALAEIPYGETRSYSQIAAKIGRPKASRAVGMACNKNPLWILIPCHRVLGKNQKLTGYAGGLDRKQALLDLEQQYL